jgi:integrase
LYYNKRHPQDMGAAEVEAFLSHLAMDRQVSASTQNQAKAALLYLFRQVLGVELPWLDEVVQARRPQRLPVVLTPTEVRALLQHMNGTTALVAGLLQGTGMRLLEGLRLRVKDVEFARREIIVRQGQGGRGISSPLDGLGMPPERRQASAPGDPGPLLDPRPRQTRGRIGRVAGAEARSMASSAQCCPGCGALRSSAMGGRVRLLTCG